MGLEAVRLVAAYLRFQAEVPDFSGDVARRVVELLQVRGLFCSASQIPIQCFSWVIN